MLIKIILRPFPGSAASSFVAHKTSSSSRTISQLSSSRDLSIFGKYSKSALLTLSRASSSSYPYQYQRVQRRSSMAQIDLAVNTQSGCLEFLIPRDSSTKDILSNEALVFLKKLHRNFGNFWYHL